MKFEWVIDDDEEEAPSWWRYGPDLEGDAYRALFIHLCEQADGHAWYLEIDPDDGVSLYCRKCYADTNDLYPDGIDLLGGDFEVYPGYILNLRSGSVFVNDEFRDGHVYGWRGPVSVELHVEKYTSMDWIGYEYDAWIVVEKHDA